MKVKIVNKFNYSTIVNLDKNTRLSPHFRLFEVANNKGDKSIEQMILSPRFDDFLGQIEEFRVWWNKPMNCNSCFRQVEYNRSIGGAENSLHLLALAFDWGESLTYSQRVAVYTKWREITTKAGRIGGINFYPWGCHIDSYEDLFGHRAFVIRDKDRIVNYVPKP